jgi:hypothetical protein
MRVGLLLVFAGCTQMLGLDSPVQLDGSNMDASLDACTSCSVHRVFVTNLAFPNGDIDQPDKQCQDAATARGLGGAWVAWLASGNSSPSTKVAQDNKAYVLLDGETIASNWQDLTDGMLTRSIAITEYGMPYTGNVMAVWTNTTVNGHAVATSDVETCFDFTIAGSPYSAMAGRLDRRDAMWTQAAEQSCACGSNADGCPAHLYCFEN